MADTPTRPPKKTITPGAWQEARGLVYAHRRRLGVGLGLLLVNRVAGFVLPVSPKWVIDRVIGQHHPELLVPLALAAGGATLVQALTGFALSQVLGVAAQRAITDMRRTVQAYVLRLPVSYFDSTKSGILISRIMSDAEGIRNLVGTGLVQLVGGLLTGAVALVVLFVLNWRLTAIAILILACFGAGMALAFTKLRPLFRERGKINAEVTGRLAETLGGIRIVKAYHAERSERLVFTRGANTLFRNIAATMTGISGVGSFATIIIGAIGILMILEGGGSVLAGAMTLGDLFMYGIFVGLVAMPLINIASIRTQITEAFAGFDGTIAENIAFARPHATRAEIEAAARIAHCDDFVRRFDKGYDTVVGERGVKLSGGERQRVSIARAILADPRILILDEATSSLDSESEAAIQDGLRTLRRGRTTFVIAHRLSTIRSADQILVMEGGEIVERGTHAELLAKHGRYRQLYDKQYRFEQDLFINPGEDFTPEPEAPALPTAVTPPTRL